LEKDKFEEDEESRARMQDTLGERGLKRAGMERRGVGWFLGVDDADGGGGEREGASKSQFIYRKVYKYNTK
jgi:hypothetical protein